MQLAKIEIGLGDELHTIVVTKGGPRDFTVTTFETIGGEKSNERSVPWSDAARTFEFVRRLAVADMEDTVEALVDAGEG